MARPRLRPEPEECPDCGRMVRFYDSDRVGGAKAVRHKAGRLRRVWCREGSEGILVERPDPAYQTVRFSLYDLPSFAVQRGPGGFLLPEDIRRGEGGDIPMPTAKAMILTRLLRAALDWRFDIEGRAAGAPLLQTVYHDV